MTNNAARYWTWTTPELKAYLGIGARHPRSPYLEGKDFSPDILSLVTPKQLVDSETHAGFIPVRMGEDGKYQTSRAVDKMLGGIPRRIIRQAEDHIRQYDRTSDLVKTYHTYRRMVILPLVTLDDIAEALHLSDGKALIKRLDRFVWAVDRYLHAVATGWPEGTDLEAEYEAIDQGNDRESPARIEGASQ